MFSLDQLIFAMAADQRCSIETLAQVEPMIKAMLDKEKMLRSSIKVSDHLALNSMLNINDYR